MSEVGVWKPDALQIGGLYQLGQLTAGTHFKIARTEEYGTVIGFTTTKNLLHVRIGEEQKRMSSQLRVYVTSLPRTSRNQLETRLYKDRKLYTRLIGTVLKTLFSKSSHDHPDIAFTALLEHLSYNALYRLTVRYEPTADQLVILTGSIVCDLTGDLLKAVPAVGLPYDVFLSKLPTVHEALAEENVNIDELFNFLQVLHLHKKLTLEFTSQPTGRAKRIHLRFAESERFINLKRNH